MKTAANGWCKAKLPISDTYTLYCGREEPAFRKAKIGDFPFVTSELRTYTHRFVRFKFSYKNPSGKPLPNESVTLTSDKTGKQYKDTTDANGMAIFDLPFDPSFTVAVKYFDNVKTLVVNDVDKEYKVMSMDFTWMGAKEKEHRAYVADSLAKAYYKAYFIDIDSLLLHSTLEDILKHDVHIPITHDSLAFVVDALTKKATLYKKLLADTATLFEDKRQPVLAVLYRMKDKFKNKILVTDVTGSMYPYMQEIALWLAMDFEANSSSKYVFFNDGDGKAKEEKVIGSTGGFHYCQGQGKDFTAIIKTLRKAVELGEKDTDVPENDVEALIYASQKGSKDDALILIADNYSMMRDYAQIKYLKVPVHVILCGVEGRGCKVGRCCRLWYDVNEEYLNLAYQTKGSVHSIHDDYYDLHLLKNGDRISLEGVSYVLYNGAFHRSY